MTPSLHDRSFRSLASALEHALEAVRVGGYGRSDFRYVEYCREVASRVRQAVGNATFREIGDATGLSPETIRRTLQGDTLSMNVLVAIIATYRLDPNWVLFGFGPMRLPHSAAGRLTDVSTAELRRELDRRTKRRRTPVGRRPRGRGEE